MWYGFSRTETAAFFSSSDVIFNLLCDPNVFIYWKSSRVPVAVWEISDEDEKSLDRYEGFPRYYVKKEWTVKMNDGSEIKGMVYVMNLIRPQPPTVGYYNGIFDAYNKLGLGSEIETVLEPALQRSLSRLQR